jgi:tetratricopeptide (TPR) repeat protein
LLREDIEDVACQPPREIFSKVHMIIRPFRFALIFGLLLAGVEVCFGQAQQSQPPAGQSSMSEIERVQALLGEGKPDSAIELLKSIPKSAAIEPQINHLLGLAYYQKNDYTRAIEYLSLSARDVQRDSKQYRQATALIGMSHFLLGHMKEATMYLEQVKSWAPDNVEMMYALGVSYIQTHDLEKARETFARIFAVPPGSASAYLINAQMLIRQQFEEFAEKELVRALEMDPKLPQVHFLLGEMAIYHAEIDRGIELLQKEIAINPAFAMAYYLLGEAYTRQLKWDKAIAPLQKAIWLNPFFSGPYIVLGKVYLKTGDLSNAESLLRRALKMDPNNFSAHYLLAQVLQRSNRLEEAKKEFELADRLRTSSDK